MEDFWPSASNHLFVLAIGEFLYLFFANINYCDFGIDEG